MIHQSYFQSGVDKQKNSADFRFDEPKSGPVLSLKWYFT